MYEDIKYLALLSISEEWTEQEFKRYGLFHKETSYEILTGQTLGINCRNSLWGWAICLAILKFDLVGFEVIRGRKTGSNIDWLERRIKS